MNLEAFLTDQLQNQSQYELTDQDKLVLENEGTDAFVFAKLTTKKFRRWSLDDATIERINTAIDIAIKEKQPLQVIFPQGGYKLWRFEDSYPEADWAEFFNIAHLVNYLAPITKGYEPGVQLYYYMHTLVPEVHDNLPTEAINAYVVSFQNLIDTFTEYLPKNFTIQISKDADFYDSREQYFETLESHVEKGKKDFEESDISKQEAMLKTSELNIKWDGKEDWTQLSVEEREAKILQGAIYEKALSYLEEPRGFTKSPDKILTFIKSGGGWLGIGSSKNSITKYWTGTGVAEMKGDKWYGRILSPSQYEDLRDSITYQEVNFLPLKNFARIGSIEEVNFVHL